MTCTSEISAFRQLIRAAKCHGAVTFRLWEGEDWACVRVSSEAALVEASNSTGQDWLYCYGSQGERLGRFMLVWQGGYPDELVADYSDNAFCENVWNAWQAAAA